MPTPNTDQSGLTWLTCALMTVVAWGVYGILLHSGQGLMKDPAAGRYKAFLFVGIAYFLTAVLAPLLVLWLKGATWSFTLQGSWWSLLAGVVGAIGAFFVLVAFGAGGSPAVVMTIVFAGAPVVNALVALALHPPAGGWAKIPWPFFAGIVLATLGGALVTLYKPPAQAPARAVVEAPRPSAAANTALRP
jgi:drug/metabolite transporter (DMT)-like permease